MLTKGTNNKLEITRHTAFQHVNKEHHIWNASQTCSGIFSKWFGFSYSWWKDAFSSLPSCIDFPDSSNDHSTDYSKPTKNLNVCVVHWMCPLQAESKKILTVQVIVKPVCGPANLAPMEVLIALTSRALLLMLGKTLRDLDWLLCPSIKQSSRSCVLVYELYCMWEERSECGGSFPFDKSGLILFFHYVREASEWPTGVKLSRDARDFSVWRRPQGHV